MVATEIQLRIGQADETLHEIRTIVGHKSFVFRKELRLARGQKESTRSWAKIHTIDSALRLQCRIYAHCRRALEGLGTTDDILERYQVLKPADVLASAAVMGENIPGKRSPDMSWIWTLDVQGDAASTDWLEECKHPCLGDKITNLPAYSLSGSLVAARCTSRPCERGGG